jgi:ubiquinone/menaquinone biosynthesis C-methylase UbiE
MLSMARSRIDALELKKCEIRYSDITKTLFSSDSVDLVMIHQVLHYFDNPSDVIKEASRLLQVNGEVFIVDFSSHSIELLRSKYSHRRLGFSPDQMNELFEKNNIEVVDFRELKIQRDSVNEDSINENLTVTLWLGKKIK